MIRLSICHPINFVNIIAESTFCDYDISKLPGKGDRDKGYRYWCRGSSDRLYSQSYSVCAVLALVSSSMTFEI